MQQLGEKHKLANRHRIWGETGSLELLRGGQKEFSFQISKRGLYLDEPVSAEWPPVLIETLRDNVASKMTALVQRGAPRDFVDIHQLCTVDVVSIDECWQLWATKNPGIQVSDAKRRVITLLLVIETTRPLAKIQQPAAREKAARVRAWYHETFASPQP